MLLLGGSSSMAVFADYNPDNPEEPSQKVFYNVRVSTTSGGEASGEGRYLQNETAFINASCYYGYQFDYWTKNGVRQDDLPFGFDYTVLPENVEFVAHFKFAPDAPGDPSSHAYRQLYLTSEPAGMCSYNRTSGEKVEMGSWVNVCAYPNRGYQLVGWFRGETLVGSSLSFDYQIGNTDETLTAKFVYSPASPMDPGFIADGEFNFNARDFDEVNRWISCSGKTSFMGYHLKFADGYMPEYDEKEGCLDFNGYARGYLDYWGYESMESGEYFARTGDDEMTIVCKVAPRFWVNYGDIISNRNGDYNYMLRIGQDNSYFLHTGNGDPAGRSLPYTSEEPQIVAFRVNTSADVILIDNITTGESLEVPGVQWGNTDNLCMKFFHNNEWEYFLGKFYWMYYSFDFKTDAEIAKIIENNETQEDVLLGDANGDGEVSVGDLSAMVGYVLNTNIVPTFNAQAADANQDGEISVGDVSETVKIILGQNDATQLPQKRDVPAAGVSSLGLDVLEVDGQEVYMQIGISNGLPFSGFQFDVSVPQPFVVKTLRLNKSRTNSDYVFAQAPQGNNVWRALCFSPENLPFANQEGPVADLVLTTEEPLQAGDYQIKIENAQMTEDGNVVRLDPVCASFTVETSGIENLGIENVVQVYDLDGRFVGKLSSEQINSLPKGIYIVGTKIKSIVK